MENTSDSELEFTFFFFFSTYSLKLVILPIK